MRNVKLDFALGLLFFAGLIGLGFATIYLSDFAFGVERHDVELLSSDVGYLRPGDPILVYGMVAGKVEGIERLDAPLPVTLTPRPGADPETVDCRVRIRARLDLDPFDHLRADHAVLIEERGLLGGKLIRVEVGGADDLLPRGSTIVARVQQTILQAGGEILEENRASLNRTITNLENITADAQEGRGTVGRLLKDDGIADQIEAMVDEVRSLTSGVAEGEGTLGKLFTEDQLHEDAKVFISDLRSFSDRAKRGEGSLGKFLQEDTFHDEALALVEDGRGLFEGVEAGEGTLGKLVKDEKLYADAEAFMANMRQFSDDAAAGEGTLGRLLEDDELYENVNGFFEDGQEIMGDIADGGGVLSLLLTDEQLADDLRNIVDQVLGAIEDARETTPVTSLGSFLFGTF